MNSKTWKPVKGYEEFYEVSSEGLVRSLFSGKLVKSYTPKGEYEMVSLRINKKSITKRVHRLVAEAFIPNPESLREVNHKDANRTNNTLENLEWVSPRENLIHASRNRLHASGERNSQAKIDEIKALTTITLVNSGLRFTEIASMGYCNRFMAAYASTNMGWKHLDFLKAPERLRRKPPKIPLRDQAA